ncbi:MAG TPA: ABC transporter substrate-binding protein [Solirubrobacteraceae bacterium]|nr:ABC transporter substrate-binding protein [Solirubrobacteraceae bacterium]
MNGRDAIRPAVALCVAAAAAICLASCGGAGNGTATAATRGPDAHTFTDVVAEVPLDLDETGTPDAGTVTLLPSWSSELVRPQPATPGPNAKLPPDDAVVPYLATSWQRASNGSYTFVLRRGVHGPSGDPLTAADVRWSLERALARSPVAPFLFSLAHINTHDPVTIIDPHRVRVNVTSPSPFTLSVLASYDAAIYDSRIYRSHATAADPWAQAWGATHSVGFGAYWVATDVPGKEIVLRANRGFWRSIWYTTVLIKYEPSPAERLDDVLSGAATHTTGLTWAEFQNADDNSAQDGVRATVLQTGPSVIAWHLNVTHGPLANPQVRQALSLGIDRVELADGLDDGLAEPDSSVVPAVFGQHQPSDFDPKAARSLLRAAGINAGELTVAVVTNEQLTDDLAPAVLGYMYKFLHTATDSVGVNLDMSYVDDPDQLLALEGRRTLESTLEVSTPLLGGAGFLLEETANTKLDPVSIASREGYANPSLQSLLDQIASSSGGSATDALITQAAQTLDTDSPTINLAELPVENVTRADVTGYAAYTEPVVYYENLHPTP